MSDPERHLLLIAGRLGLYDDGWPIRPFLDRLAGHGFSAQVLCVSAWREAASDPRVIECPGLGHRWLQILAVRNLRLGDAIRAPDLLHVLHRSVSGIGLALAERWKRPYVQTVDEFLSAGERLSLSKRWCRGLVVAGEGVADDLVGSLSVPRTLLTVIRRGVTMSDDPATPIQEGHVPVIGTAGPLVPSSGLVTFLNAARRVVDAGVDAEFVIAGQGEDEVDLRRRAERLRIADRVTFVGLPVLGLRYWNVLDVYCHTSLVPTVARPLAMALAFGVPAVASDVEGIRELVEHERTGLLVPPDDSAELSRAILELLADATHAQGLGASARSRIERQYRPEAETEALAALYHTVLARDERRVRDPAVSI